MSDYYESAFLAAKDKEAIGESAFLTEKDCDAVMKELLHQCTVEFSKGCRCNIGCHEIMNTIFRECPNLEGPVPAHALPKFDDHGVLEEKFPRMMNIFRM